MNVQTLQAQFKNNFKGTLRVYDGKSFADPKSTLASIRKGGSIKGDFDVKGNMHVGTFEGKMKSDYGIRVQVAKEDNSKLAPNNISLSKLS